ncbi:GNAT family N-acetyltransferase [Plantactinospora sp. B6F1]|uniref:GNAT family N-acetyltransferase n=1 Tax=Plantactinospora sp. B6F1 TaxID=3158971 RepID=UPI0032D8F8BD
MTDIREPREGIAAARVRLANVDDAGEILTLQRAAYLAEAQTYQDPFLPPLVESLAELAAVVAAKAVLVATRMQRIVGAVRLTVERETGHIGRLIVAPDVQGRGIGTMLLRAAEQAAPPGVARFELFTGAASTRNLALYEHLGYAAFARRRVSESVELVYLEKARS